MEQLSEFAVNHWILVTAFFAVAGLLLASVLTGASGVSVQQAVQRINREDAVVIDVRSTADFERGHIIDSISLPASDIEQAAERLKSHMNRPLLVVCASGSASNAAVRQLKSQGFTQAEVLRGGINAWQQDNLPLASS